MRGVLTGRFVRKAAALLSSVVLLTAVPGCDELGAALYLIEGPPKKEAVFELDPRRSTVILVDDRRNALPKRSLLRVMGERADLVVLNRELLRDGNLIDSRSALNAARSETRTRLKSIVDIGREVGAEVVVYVEVVRFGLTRDGQSIWPFSVVELKVFDTDENKRLFPAGGGAYQVVVPVGREPEAVNTLTRADVAELQRLLAERTGYEIARSFFETIADTRVAEPLRD